MRVSWFLHIYRDSCPAHLLLLRHLLELAPQLSDSIEVLADAVHLFQGPVEHVGVGEEVLEALRRQLCLVN